MKENTTHSTAIWLCAILLNTRRKLERAQIRVLSKNLIILHADHALGINLTAGESDGNCSVMGSLDDAAVERVLDRGDTLLFSITNVVGAPQNWLVGELRFIREVDASIAEQVLAETWRRLIWRWHVSVERRREDRRDRIVSRPRAMHVLFVS